MFENLKNAISAAETMLSDLDYSHRNAMEYYKQYAAIENRDEYDEKQFQLYKAQLELYADVKDFIETWVKA